MAAAAEPVRAAISDVSTSEVADEELVARVRDGDREAFDVVYDRYFSRVFGFVDRRLRNRADSEETTQEVFINLFSSIETFRAEASFSAWVFGVTRRTIAGRFKKKRAETVPLGDAEPDAVATSEGLRREADPLEAYEFHERLRRMDRAIDRELSPEQWTLFQLHHLENHSIQQIAERVHKSEDAVKSHLYRARKLLLAP